MQINTKLKLVYSGENVKEITIDTNNILVGEFLKRLDFSKDLISVFYGKASLNVKIKDLVSFTTESTCPIMSIHEFEEKISSKKKEKVDSSDKSRYIARKPIITSPTTDNGDKLKKAFNELKNVAQHYDIPVITGTQIDYSGDNKHESEWAPTDRKEINKSNDNKPEYKPRDLTVCGNVPTSNNIIPTAEVLKVANRLKETDEDIAKAFNEMTKVFKECKDAGLLDMEKPKRWENPIYNKYKEKITLLKNTLIKKGAFEDIHITPSRRIGKSMSVINDNSIYGAGLSKYAGSNLDSSISNFTIQKSRPVKQHISADKNKDLPERKKRLYNK